MTLEKLENKITDMWHDAEDDVYRDDELIKSAVGLKDKMRWEKQRDYDCGRVNALFLLLTTMYDE